MIRYAAVGLAAAALGFAVGNLLDNDQATIEPRPYICRPIIDSPYGDSVCAPVADYPWPATWPTITTGTS